MIHTQQHIHLPRRPIVIHTIPFHSLLVVSIHMQLGVIVKLVGVHCNCANVVHSSVKLTVELGLQLDHGTVVFLVFVFRFAHLISGLKKDSLREDWDRGQIERER